MRIEAQQFQQLADDIVDDYRKLPQITTQWRGRLGIEGLTPIAQLQYSNFDSDEQAITGQRLYGEFGMSYPKNWAYGFIRPTVKYRYLAYQLQLDEVTSNTQPHAGSEVLSLDAGLVFERATNLGGEAVIQTLEPRAFYLYSGFVHQSGQPDFDSAELTFSYHQLFRETRFSGNDRLDDANQIAIGVTTRFFSQDDGRERLNASIGQIHYFRDRKVRLLATDPALTDDGSSIAAEINWLPNDNWSLRTSLLYDTFDSDFEAASVQLRHSLAMAAFLTWVTPSGSAPLATQAASQ